MIKVIFTWCLYRTLAMLYWLFSPGLCLISYLIYCHIVVMENVCSTKSQWKSSDCLTKIMWWILLSHDVCLRYNNDAISFA